MRLLTHNVLRNNTSDAIAACRVSKKNSGVTSSNYDKSPTLSISSVTSVEVRETPPNLTFVRRMLPTLDWTGLVQVRAST
mmetsp:Transcript_22305/g.51101  ORF Transcript_22305/g.51101 Transcript_22305/m.51101 type:complete len:80 (-) Transcript_22305:1338-1577(-)